MRFTVFESFGNPCVVDSKLSVKGVKGLRICDASVFPAPVSATTQATVYAVAESLADMMLQEQ